MKKFCWQQSMQGCIASLADDARQRSVDPVELCGAGAANAKGCSGSGVVYTFVVSVVAILREMYGALGYYVRCVSYACVVAAAKLSHFPWADCPVMHLMLMDQCSFDASFGLECLAAWNELLGGWNMLQEPPAITECEMAGVVAGASLKKLGRSV
ncbi:hypothetical protein Nepgr_010288 [Nepenthes gracilis]|uniref:Uncharacterized protein n=1 Tax=Nepenthes gracilis TaxID=150966 RepID=A0AAD3SBY6_NEPGR|nr:hypothetical protein Nepgr_010288 [Nepenthes gracilis]